LQTGQQVQRFLLRFQGCHELRGGEWKIDLSLSYSGHKTPGENKGLAPLTIEIIGKVLIKLLMHFDFLLIGIVYLGNEQTVAKID
jgi:hypothetical protein